MPCPENDRVTGEITGFTDSPYGEVAFAEAEGYGAVAILLNNDHWRSAGGPQKSEIVVIEGLVRHRKGWRAIQARKFTLDDE